MKKMSINPTKRHNMAFRLKKKKMCVCLHVHLPMLSAYVCFKLRIRAVNPDIL